MRDMVIMKWCVVAQSKRYTTANWRRYTVRTELLGGRQIFSVYRRVFLISGGCSGRREVDSGSNKVAPHISALQHVLQVRE